MHTHKINYEHFQTAERFFRWIATHYGFAEMRRIRRDIIEELKRNQEVKITDHVKRLVMKYS